MDQRITWAMAEIEGRLAESLDVRRLAAAVNLSPSRFSHLFRAESGVPPLRYIRDRRMDRARLLLERTFLSVREVMVQVGCNDPSHFARDFRKRHGVPPREWRTAVGHGRREPPRHALTDAADCSAADKAPDPPGDN